jgi:hypothetical protein
MTIPNSASARFVLPTRIRSRLGPSTGYAARSRLAARIGGLPGIQIFKDVAGQPQGIIASYLPKSRDSLRQRLPEVPFCRIAPNGISVHGLTDTERYHVLSRGWGRLENRNMLLFLPRDEDEFDVSWYILRHAYEAVSNPSATSVSAARAPLPELPEFSRTTLC